MPDTFTAIPFTNELTEASISSYLRRGGDPNRRDVDGKGHTLLTLLLDQCKGATPEVRQPYLQMMQLLCSKGADWELPDNHQNTPSQLAEEIGLSQQDIQFILSIQRQKLFALLGQIEINPDKEIHTILSQLATFFVQGVDPNSRNVSKRGETPLTFLLEAYSSAEERIQARLIDAMVLITRRGGDWAMLDGAGQTPIQLAHDENCLNALLPAFVTPIEDIAEEEDKVVTVDQQKETHRLFSLLPSARIETIRHSLEAGADVNQPYGKKGRTPLTFLLHHCKTISEHERKPYLDVMGLLVDHRASWTQPDDKGRTPKELAAEIGLSLLDLPSLSILRDPSDWNIESKHPDTSAPYILFLGAGNMSFELSFAKKHPQLAPFMVVTIYEPIEKAKQRVTMRDNEAALKAMGAIVLYGMDATQLHTYLLTRVMRFQDIYFSHPHTGDPKTTPQLVEDCFHSASQIQTVGSRLHLIRLRGGDKTCFPEDSERGRSLNAWYKKLYGLSGSQLPGYQLVQKSRFNTKRYPDYNHAQTKKISSAPNVTGDNSIEYVFERVEQDALTYHSDLVSSDDCSDINDVHYIEQHARYRLLPYLLAAETGDMTQLEAVFQQRGEIKIEITTDILKHLESQCDVVTALHNMACYYESLAYRDKQRKPFLCTLGIAKAESIFNVALMYTQRSPDIALLTEFACFLCRAGRYEEAITYLQKAVNDRSAVLDYSLFEKESVCPMMKLAIEAHNGFSVPASILAYYLLVKTHKVLGEEAIAKKYVKEFEHVLRQDYSIEKDYACLLGYAYQWLGDLDNARRIFNEILAAPRYRLAEQALQGITQQRLNTGSGGDDEKQTSPVGGNQQILFPTAKPKPEQETEHRLVRTQSCGF